MAGRRNSTCSPAADRPPQTADNAGMRTTRNPLRKPAPPARVQPIWRQYYDNTQRPLYCLLFLFPLVATHEFGALLLRPVVWPERQLVAYRVIEKLLAWFGASGFWLPAVVLLLTLLIWHVLCRDPWRIRGWVLLLMVIESVVLTAPLLVLGRVMMQAGAEPIGPDLREQIVLALGAGIYEELVFRLYLIAGLTLLFESVLRAKKDHGLRLALVLSAMAFAVCHFAPIGSAPFAWRHFLLLLVAGAYLGLIFVRRGLGVAAGCHAAFNLIPLLWV